MIRSFVRASVFGLVLVGAVDSAAQQQPPDLPDLPSLVVKLDPGAPPIVLTEEEETTILLTEGAMIQIEVKLDSWPQAVSMGSGTVSFEITGLPSGLTVTFSPSSLTFKEANWNTFQRVFVDVGHDDDAVPANGRFEYTIEVPSLNIPPVSGDRIPVRIDDDDIPAVSGVSVRPLADGFEASWTPLGRADGYRVEYVPATEPFLDPGSNQGDDIMGANVSSTRVSGLVPYSVYKVRIMAFQGPGQDVFSYGIPALAPRLVVVGEDGKADPAFSDSTDAASALVARGFGSSVLEAVASRIDGDREPVAHASATAAALAAWARFLAHDDLSGPVLSVHERSTRERDEILEGHRARRPAGPVERGDSSWWFRADAPGLGAHHDGSALDGSARILHFGFERSIEPPGAADRLASAMDSDGEWIAGLGLGLASASIEADPGGASLENSTRLVYPYLGYRDNRKLVYAAVGAGLGTSTIRHPSFQAEAADQDSLLLFAGLGGSAVVAGRPDRLEFLVRASVLGTLANTDPGPVLDSSTVAAHRLRFGLDTRHVRSMWGGMLSPSAGIGILYDAGDGPGGAALELDTGARFDWRRLSLSGRARTIVTSSDDLDRVIGISGAVRYSPGGLGRGFFLALSPAYGAGPDNGSLWDRVLAASGPEPSRLRLSTEVGYAFSAAPVPGLVTVVTGVHSGRDEAADVVGIGIRYRLRDSLVLGIGINHAPGSAALAAPLPKASFHARWSF